MKIKNKFPNISRFITDKENASYILLSVLILIAIVFITVDLGINLGKLREKNNQTQAVEQEITFWQKQTDKHDNFRDAYFRLALLEYRIGDFNKSKDYTEKALSIDPNFKQGIDFEKILSGN